MRLKKKKEKKENTISMLPLRSSAVIFSGSSHMSVCPNAWCVSFHLQPVYFMVLRMNGDISPF